MWANNQAATIFISQLLETSVVALGSFLRTLFSSRVMLSLAVIPLLEKKGLIAFQNDLLHFFAATFRMYIF